MLLLLLHDQVLLLREHEESILLGLLLLGCIARVVPILCTVLMDAHFDLECLTCKHQVLLIHHLLGEVIQSMSTIDGLHMLHVLLVMIQMVTTTTRSLHLLILLLVRIALVMIILANPSLVHVSPSLRIYHVIDIFRLTATP